MAEYIGCRKCDSPDCKGCNLKNLETMLNNGKFDCLMNGNRCINTFADVTIVRRGKWTNGNPNCPVCGKDKFAGLDADIWADWQPDYCPNCGAKMDEEGRFVGICEHCAYREDCEWPKLHPKIKLKECPDFNKGDKK